MSISITNKTTTNNTKEIILNAFCGVGGTVRKKIIKGAGGVEIEDYDAPEIHLSFLSTQDIDHKNEAKYYFEIEYATGCKDYIQKSFIVDLIEMEEIPGTPYPGIITSKKYTLILIKQNNCPHPQSDTHININIKHPPVGGGG